jgi:hypothetical protein
MLPNDAILFRLAVFARSRGRLLLLPEQIASELTNRWLCGLAEVSVKSFENGLLSRAEMKKILAAAVLVDSLPIFIVRTSDR